MCSGMVGLWMERSEREFRSQTKSPGVDGLVRAPDITCAVPVQQFRFRRQASNRNDHANSNRTEPNQTKAIPNNSLPRFCFGYLVN